MDIQAKDKLAGFLKEVLPENIPASAELEDINTYDTFIKDVMEGIDAASMSIRLTPHIMSLINWNDPLNDPLRRQFIPMKSALLPYPSQPSVNSLHESLDSPVSGLIRRYPDKALFLGLSHASHSTLLNLMSKPALLRSFPLVRIPSVLTPSQSRKLPWNQQSLAGPQQSTI